MSRKRKAEANDRRLTSQDEEDLMTERSPFFMTIELKQVKQEEPEDEIENITPTTELGTPRVAQLNTNRSALAPRSPNIGAPKAMTPAKTSPPRANMARNVSQPAELPSKTTFSPVRSNSQSQPTRATQSAIDMALHIFAAFPVDHELHIGAERTFVKERVETMLQDFGSGYETQALWVGARLRERQVQKEHIEAVIERLLEVEAEVIARWLQSKVKDVLLLQSVCRKIVAGDGAGEDKEAR